MEFDDVIRGSIDGDDLAQFLLYKQIYPILFKVCFRYSSSKEEGEDWLQDVFIKIFNQLETFNGSSYKELGAWVKVIAINNCIDQLRRVKLKTSSVNFERLNVDEDDDSFEEEYSIEEITEAIRSLSPTYRVVFNMFILDDYTHKQIENEIGLNPGASSSILYKAKQKLRKILEAPTK